MHAVILAGGKGTRLGKLTIKNPKPLIKIGNKPLIEHQINLLAKNDIKNIWMLSGYLGDKIKNFAGDGSKWSVKIKHIIEQKSLGTAGSIKQLEGRLKKDFLVLSGDVMVNMDIKRLIKFHENKVRSIATIVVHSSDHPFDSDLVKVDENWRIISFLIRKDKTQPKNIFFRNLTNTGVFIFSPKIFTYIKKDTFRDLEINILPKVLVKKEDIYAYNTPEYIKDMGTIERLDKVRRDYKNRRIAKLNLKNKQRAIFLDRDGTINQLGSATDVGPSRFHLYPFSAKAIKKINHSGFLAIVITNQPAIAKGFIAASEVELIHRKLDTELGKKEAIINGIYYCPHHPEIGFEGEIKSLKINCSCRKPKIGLIEKAVKNFNIDLTKSYLVGDSTTDAKCAKNANIRFIGVKTGYGLNDRRYNYSNLKIVKNLLYAVNFILRKNQTFTLEMNRLD